MPVDDPEANAFVWWCFRAADGRRASSYRVVRDDMRGWWLGEVEGEVRVRGRCSLRQMREGVG